MRLQDGAHEDTRSTAPDAGLDQVAGDGALEHVFDAPVQIVEPFDADHRVGVREPLPAVDATAAVALREHERLVARLHELEGRVLTAP